MSIYGYKPKTRPALWRSVHPASLVEKKRKWFRPVSKRNRSRMAKYREASAAFVAKLVSAGKTCPVVAAVPQLRDGFRYGYRISNRITETHHSRGRAGSLLMDERFWIGMSKLGHRWVHQNPIEARALGFLCAAGLWNNPPKRGECLGCGCDVDPACELCGECVCEEDGL